MIKIIGIYEIINSITGHKYIGSSQNIELRKKEHYNDLSKNKHHCIALQRAWNKYSGFNFNFNILEKCQIEKLIEKEQYYFDLNNKKELYNSTLIAGRCEMTDEIRNKISQTKIKNGSGIGVKNSMYGKKQSKESIEKNRLSNIGKQAGNKNAMYGKHHSESTKEKIRNKLKNYTGDKNPNTKTFIFYSPCGIKHVVKGMFEKFCKEQKFREKSLLELFRKNKEVHYHGWTVLKGEL